MKSRRRRLFPFRFGNFAATNPGAYRFVEERPFEGRVVSFYSDAGL